MFALLFLLACGGDEAPAPADEAPVEAPAEEAPAEEAPAEAAPKVTPAAFVGDWVKGEKILATDKEGMLKLMQDGDVVMSGKMEGKGLQRRAALDGCGAKLKLTEVGGDMMLRLSGPECPVEFNGKYTNTVSP